MNKAKIENEQEAGKIRARMFDLQYELDDLQKVYNKHLESKYLKENKKKWENRVFHNLEGSGIFYVIEVNKYGVRGIVLNGWFAGLEGHYSSPAGHTQYSAHFVFNVWYSLEEFKNASEWRGAGKREYERLVEKVEMMKEFFIDKNLSD